MTFSPSTVVFSDPVAHGQTTRRRLTPLLLQGLGASGPQMIHAISEGIAVAALIGGAHASEQSLLAVGID